MILSLFLGGEGGVAAAVSVVGSDDSFRQQSNLKRECRALFAVVACDWGGGQGWAAMEIPAGLRTWRVCPGHESVGVKNDTILPSPVTEEPVAVRAL